MLELWTHDVVPVVCVLSVVYMYMSFSVFVFLLTSFSLPSSELSLVGLALECLDVVDKPWSFSATKLLVGSSDS